MLKKILVLSANPQGDLKLSQEIRDIREGLMRSANREQFTLETREAVRVEDLTIALLELKPWIVHFCGHGSGSEGLVLENNAGSQHFVSTEALANLFRHFTDKVECVLLNACYSQVQAQEIVKHINYVIGMRQDILDDAARAFTRGFYQALGNGESINFAYEWGCDRIQLEINRSTATRQGKVVGVTETLKVPEHLIPVLLKNPNPVTISSPEPVEELKNSDLEKIVDLLIRSGRAEYSARKALCIKIGIEPHQIGFLRQSTDADFALELINYLHTIDNQQALCKLCNQLETVFKTGRYASDLNNIKSKLNFK